MSRDRYLLRTNPDGARQASWRTWVLVWVLPVCFVAGALYMAGETLYLRSVTVETKGEVAHVYQWENDAPRIFYPGEHVYSPRFRYVWTDGTETEATPGRSHTDWNFEIGSHHAIRYHPGEKTDVIIAGPTEWLVLRYLLWIAAACLVISMIARWRIRAWLRGGETGSALSGQ